MFYLKSFTLVNIIVSVKVLVIREFMTQTLNCKCRVSNENFKNMKIINMYPNFKLLSQKWTFCEEYTAPYGNVLGLGRELQ